MDLTFGANDHSVCECVTVLSTWQLERVRDQGQMGLLSVSALLTSQPWLSA